MAEQLAAGRCDCGAATVIMATDSPWEFDWRCTRGTHRGVISWAHAAAPPLSSAPQAVIVQGDLFQGRGD